ncbi:hypothetical protein AB0N24_22215 [Arthrobacter sp. NPDC093128]|uniref:hypothetical protein n=1 Tax=Arthrobacter sp. NPDC093128 TaxID=3154979 RepID=UPI00341D4DAA
MTAGLAIDYGDVRRDNVAAFIHAALHNPNFSRVIVELTDGVTAAAQAVAQLAKSAGHPNSSQPPENQE